MKTKYRMVIKEMTKIGMMAHTEETVHSMKEAKVLQETKRKREPT